jgi:hypothetical protein
VQNSNTTTKKKKKKKKEKPDGDSDISKMMKWETGILIFLQKE